MGKKDKKLVNKALKKMGMEQKSKKEAKKGAETAKKGAKKEGKKGPQKNEPEKEEGEWMGGVSDEDADKILSSGESDEEPDCDDESEVSDVPPPDDADNMGSDGEELLGALGDVQSGSAQSKMLSRVVTGQQSGDINTLKQRIKDDAALLGNWRQAKQLGDKRTREQVLKSLVADCSTYFGYAEELAEYFLQMFAAEQAIEFFEANEKSRPLTIRCNSLKARRPALMQALTGRKVTLDPIGDWTKVGLKVYESSVPVGATPEYLGGQYMIQSASSLIPVMALAPQQDENILDMAAAPGGKTTHIGQLMRNTGVLFANDMRKDRCKALAANVHRMGLTNVIVSQMDGRKMKEHLPKMDRILLDAPCSGSGIISRDPSVKVKRGSKAFEECSILQKELLTAAIDMIEAKSKTGGYIIYSTCSVSVEENEAVIEHVLKTRNVELVSFSSAVNFGVEGFTKFREKRFHPSMSHCRRYYPHVHNMDGFFVAKLKKTSNDIPDRIKKQRGKVEDVAWGEEKWTPEMMETIVDIKEPGTEEVDNKPKNKVERKKLKRKLVLAARAAAGTAVGVAAAKAAGIDVELRKQEEPKKEEPKKEEPKPEAAAKAGAKAGTKRKSTGGAAKEAAAGAQQTDASPKAAAKKKRKST